MFDIALDADDKSALGRIFARSTGPGGDCYDLDRVENRDAIENLDADYFDVENGQLVTKTRELKGIAEPYGHHLLTGQH